MSLFYLHNFSFNSNITTSIPQYYQRFNSFNIIQTAMYMYVYFTVILCKENNCIEMLMLSYYFRENLSVSPAVWWMKALLINFWLFVLLFFMTTPSIIMNLLNEINYKKALEELHVRITNVIMHVSIIYIQVTLTYMYDI